MSVSNRNMSTPCDMFVYSSFINDSPPWKQTRCLPVEEWMNNGQLLSNKSKKTPEKTKTKTKDTNNNMDI